MHSEGQASLETLPLELQEQIFEYVLDPGPSVNIILRDGHILNQESHFNVLPKNPPHPFAREKCNPPHELDKYERLQCKNTEYKRPKQWNALYAPITRTWAISVIYQISPVPFNYVCISQRIHKAVVSVWYRLRRKLKTLLDSQIVCSGWKNVQHCGSYRIIWYSHFLQETSEEMLLLCQRSRFIFDLEGHSLFATLSTMAPKIPPYIQNLVVTQDMLPSLKGDTVLSSLRVLGVLVDDQKEIPWWSVEFVGGQYGLEKLKFIERPWGINISTRKSAPQTTESNEFLTRLIRLLDPGSRFSILNLTEEEIHDVGRYMVNVFREEKDGFYYQQRVALEESVFEIEIVQS